MRYRKEDDDDDGRKSQQDGDREEHFMKETVHSMCAFVDEIEKKIDCFLCQYTTTILYSAKQTCVRVCVTI